MSMLFVLDLQCTKSSYNMTSLTTHDNNSSVMDDSLSSFSSMCENIRNNMAAVVSLKSKGKDCQTEIAELRVEGSFNFLSLKQLNRAAQVRCKLLKDNTLESKQKLDGYKLKLENLQYEISHLHKEINNCLEFRSRHDEISLIPPEEFYNDAPAEISRKETTLKDEHLQMLARLDWELEQRKQLAAKREHLIKVKEGVMDEIATKKQHLQTLTPSLQTLLKSSLPLQEAFNLPVDWLRKQHELARLLPRPLFVLFLQAKAYQEACDHLMEVEIAGDEKAAHRLLQQQIQAERNAEDNATSRAKADDSESDQEEKDDQDSGHGRRKRKRDDSEMDCETSGMSKGMFSYHPLYVTVKIKMTECGLDLRLKFLYLSKFKFILVGNSLDSGAKVTDPNFLEPDNLLCCLYPDDYGMKCPNSSAYFQFEKMSESEIDGTFQKLGRPYIWAQQLCGLEFISSETCRKPGEDMQISFSHMRGTITSLRNRVKSRIQLARQLQHFSSNMVQCDEATSSLLPPEIHTALVSWEKLSFVEFSALPQNKPIVKQGFLDEDKKTEQHSYFLATFRRGNTVTLKASVVVFVSYPVEVPLIMLLLDWRGQQTSESDLNIREMEAEVNVHWPNSLSASSTDDVLSAQLLRLMTMLDIYVETECDRSDATQPLEFSMNRICPKASKGPARLKPFMYRAETKMHFHR